MRILFVTNNYTPYSGGVVSSIQSTVQELQENGHDVRIVTLNFLGADHNDPEYVYRIPSALRFKRKHNYFAIPWRMNDYLMNKCKEFKPDIVHVHHPFLLGVSAMRIARLLRIPVVFTYHTMYEAYAHYIPFPVVFTRSLIKKRAITFCNKIDVVFAPSNAIAQDIAHCGVSKPVTVIPSAIKSNFLQNDFEIKSKKESFSLLVVSRFTPEKNVEMVIDLFAQLPQDGSFALTLVGYGMLEQKLRELAFKKYNLSPELVTFIIKPSQDKLVEIYKEADLFIFSSTTDTQGLVLAESMSQGTPVVAINGPGQQSIIKNGENGFIVSNKDQILQKIIEVSTDVVLHEQLQKGAWQTAREYSAQVCVAKIVRAYQDLL